MQYNLRSSKRFERDAKKLFKKNDSLRSNVTFILDILKNNPFSPKLQTHKANTKNHGLCFINYWWSFWKT